MTGRGIFDVDRDTALDLLRAAWEGAYTGFTVADKPGSDLPEYSAVSDDGEGRRFAGQTPDALNAALCRDWAGWEAR